MSKDQLIKWIGVSILVLSLSSMLSFLLYLGPMLASMLIAIFIGKPKYNVSKKTIAKAYLLVIGIIGLILPQVIILEVSRLTLALNVLSFVLVFIGVLASNKKQPIVG